MQTTGHLAFRAAKVVSAALCVWLLAGCWVYSVYPLADKNDDLVFDKALLGNWSQPSGCSLTFSRFFEEKTYRVVYASPSSRNGDCLLDAGKTAAFEGRLVEIGGVRFLDAIPADREAMHHQIVVHSFYKLKLQGDDLTLSPLDINWLRAQMNQGTLSLTMRDDGDAGVVLTSPTDKLRDFLTDYASTDQAFVNDPRLKFHRRSEQ